MKTQISKTEIGFRVSTGDVGVVKIMQHLDGWEVVASESNRQTHGAVGVFGTHPQLIEAFREAKELSRSSFDMWRAETEGQCPPVPQEQPQFFN